MSLETKFKQEFSQITPLSDNNRICRNVTERANKMKETRKTRIRRAPFIAAAAAVATAAGAVTVGAVNNWDFNAAFQGVFGRITEKRGESVDRNSDFNFEEYGKPLDLKYDCGSFALDIKGICADNTNAYILYDVVFDEGYDYGKRAEWSDWRLYPTVIQEAGSEKYNWSVRSDILSQDDNLFSFYASVSFEHDSETLAGKTLPLEFDELFRQYVEWDDAIQDVKEEKQALDCGVRVDIPIDFEVCSEVCTYDIGESIKFPRLDVEAVLNSISVTPFSWEVEIAADFPEDANPLDARLTDFGVDFSDGTSISLSMNNAHYNYSLDGNIRTYRNVFSQPIDPQDIVSVTAFGEIIPIK